MVSGSVECGAVTSVRYLGDNTALTTSEGAAGVAAWGWGHGGDLLEARGDIVQCDFQPRGLDTTPGGAVMVWGDTHVGRVDTRAGARMLDSRHVPGEAGVQSVASSSAGHVTWAVDSRGHVATIDWRVADPAAVTKLGDGAETCARVTADSSDHAAVVTDTGTELRVWDLRDPARPACHVSHDPVTRDTCPMTVGGGRVVLGLAARVRVYSLRDLGLVFEHRGHRSEVTGVMCGRGDNSDLSDNLVISCDSKQRLHAWVPSTQ